VRVNLDGLQAKGVMFQAAVSDAVGHIVKQTSEQPTHVPRGDSLQRITSCGF